ncbi:thiol peroxidase [Pokkaliibacter sp. CJK22405]|uniref:thiol peroxidase n=1 Tax=Pokkaliibacter sp. CJK22405 TaxID=3384615 RepID=UPI0039849FBF
MATVTLQGNPVQTIGELPAVGSQAPAFTAVKTDLSELTLESLKGKRVVLNIFPSVDTGTCAQSVRMFNQKASSLDNTVVICISKDLPFALARFCGAEGLENVIPASAFRSAFAKDYGIEMTSGPIAALCARSVVVIDTEGKVSYTQLVSEIADEPDYDAALKAL